MNRRQFLSSLGAAGLAVGLNSGIARGSASSDRFSSFSSRDCFVGILPETEEINGCIAMLSGPNVSIERCRTQYAVEMVKKFRPTYSLVASDVTRMNRSSSAFFDIITCSICPLIPCDTIRLGMPWDGNHDSSGGFWHNEIGLHASMETLEESCLSRKSDPSRLNEDAMIVEYTIAIARIARHVWEFDICGLRTSWQR